MESPKIEKEHEWLQQLVGNWRFEAECDSGPDQPPSKITGTETVRSLGGLWTVGEGGSQTSEGSGCSTIMTLGYDPVSKRFVGTFIAAVMTHLWPYQGNLDASGNSLILNSEGPSFTDSGKMAKYQDTIEIVNKDHRRLSSKVLDEKGEWHHFMKSDYYRVD